MENAKWRMGKLEREKVISVQFSGGEPGQV